MERIPNDSEANKSFSMGARRALNSGLSVEELKNLVDQESKSVSVGEDIRAFLMEYVSKNKVQISQPADFDAVAAEYLERMREWHDKPDMTLEEVRTEMFTPWQEAERGLAYFSPVDQYEVDMYFKGSDGQLYRVALDLKPLKYSTKNGEYTVSSDSLSSYLLAHSPFKAFSGAMISEFGDYEEKKFMKCVTNLLEASRQRRDGEMLQQKEATRQSLLDQLGL